MDLSGRVALVVGAARSIGVGAVVARRLAEAGADVVCADQLVPPGHPDPDHDSTVVTEAQLDAVVATVVDAGRRSRWVDVDLADEAQVDAAVAATVESMGRLDICCNIGAGAAPMMGGKAMLDLDTAGWDRAIGLNLTGAFHLTRAAARAMVANGVGGSIVHLGSYAAVDVGSGPSAFTVAKVGAEALTKVMARELAPRGVRVNTVHPLCIDAGSGGNPGLVANAIEAGRDPDEWLREMVPMGRFQRPDETAAMIVFLCSDEASFVSGQAIAVSGGANC